jgi:deoxyadenosine/deoxycytidine kinase
MATISHPENTHSIRIGVVGPCGSGKTTLINLLKLKRPDLELYHIAQEHSYVADMWERLIHPDILIFLEAGFETATARRKLSWNISDYREQQRRLSHARHNADLVIQTDDLSPSQIAEKACVFIDDYFSNNPG